MPPRPDANLREQVICALKIGGLDRLPASGHDLYEPAFYVEQVGLPRAFVEPLVQVHTSDTRGDPKHAIFGPDGQVLPELVGVYNLTLLRRLYALLSPDTDPPRAYGRGTEARRLHEEIRRLVSVA